jgi:hypothetical protein
MTKKQGQTDPGGATPDEKLAGSLGRFLPPHFDLGVTAIEQRGLDFGAFQQDVKAHFEAAVVRIYRRAIESSLEAVGADTVAIALKLQKHRGVRKRWADKVRTMSWDAAFLALAAFDVDAGVVMPRGREVVVQGVAAAVGYVRETVLRQPGHHLGRAELECLHFASFSPSWWYAQETGDPKWLAKAANHVISKMGPHAAGGGILHHRDIQRVMGEWWLPWLLFHVVIPFDWSFVERSDADIPA